MLYILTRIVVRSISSDPFEVDSVEIIYSWDCAYPYLFDIGAKTHKDVAFVGRAFFEGRIDRKRQPIV